LGISTRQFRRWKVELEMLGKDAFPGKGRSRDEEVTALERELAYPWGFDVSRPLLVAEGV
jgi:transposase